MNSARPLRRAEKAVTPKSCAKKVRTGARTVTPRILSFTASGATLMVTPAEPSVNPFFDASFFAAVTAPLRSEGRKTTPASAAASAARCTRIRFNSYQATSATRPTKPKSRVSMSATMTRVWPRSSRNGSFRDIHRHHGAVGDAKGAEIRHQEADRGASSIRVAHGHADRVDRLHVGARAREPRLALLDEVERLTVDHRAAVELVGPDVRLSGGLQPACGRLPDPDLRDVGEGDPGARPDQDTFDRGDDEGVDRPGARRLAGAAAQRPAAVDEGPADACALARRGRHRHRIAREVRELHETEHEDEEDRRKDERELDGPLSSLRPDESRHSCGSARVMVLSVKGTPVPVRRAREVSQRCWSVTR